MTYTFELAHRVSRFRAPLFATLLALAFGACDTADRLTNTTSGDQTDPAAIADPLAGTDTPDAEAALADSLAQLDAAADPTGGQPGTADELFGSDELGEEITVLPAGATAADGAAPAEGLSLASTFRGGIPFGTFALPTGSFGTIYNGSVSVISPYLMISYLNLARRTGTRLVVSFVGSNRHYKNANGSFSLSKWKARVARYRGLPLASYISDGTLVGHYILDEPNDPSNWGGTLVSRATLDEMARYSKSLFPTLPTLVRTTPKYLSGYSYRFLDGAWAQYHSRFKDPKTWLTMQVQAAKAAGLSLVAGMNHLAGGTAGGQRGFWPGSYAMTATQLRNWGSAMLSDAYPCAFLGWKFNTTYLSRTDIKSAMAYLSSKARAKPIKSCRGA